MLFELVDWDIKKAYQHYNHFVIGNETEGYAVKGLGESYGDAGDSFSGHVNMKFTTADKDQDTRVEYNCAAYNSEFLKQGFFWWLFSCCVVQKGHGGTAIATSATSPVCTSTRDFCRRITTTYSGIRFMGTSTV